MLIMSHNGMASVKSMSTCFGLMDHPWGNHFRYYWKEFEANILLYYNQTERSIMMFT